MGFLPQFYEDRIGSVLSVLGQDAVDCLTTTLKTLGACVNTLASEQPEFHQTNLTGRLRVSNGPTRCRGTHILILGYCVDLLYAGVLLLLTGYNGRALSCVRDVYEGLRFADSCLSNADAASNWLEGKRLNKPKGHKFPPEIDLGQQAKGILNAWGTHPQYESAMSAWISRARLCGEMDEIDRFLVLRDFATLLDASSKGLSYVLRRHTDLDSKHTGAKKELEDANAMVQTTMVEVLKLYDAFIANA